VSGGHVEVPCSGGLSSSYLVGVISEAVESSGPISNSEGDIHLGASGVDAGRTLTMDIHAADDHPPGFSGLDTGGSSILDTHAVEDYPPGFSGVDAGRSSIHNNRSEEEPLLADGSLGVIGSGPSLEAFPPLSSSPGETGLCSTDQSLGAPMSPSYRDILLAHLPVYSDIPPDKEGVSSMEAELFRDVTIRRKKKGNRLTRSVMSDDFVPLSVRLAGGSGFSGSLDSGGYGSVADDISDNGALRGLPHKLVRK